MDRKALLIEKIERIRTEISISEVAQDFMSLRRYGMSLKGLCPFHPDHTIGSFVITDSKGIWKCFSCGVGGDNVKFFALKTNTGYFEAGIELGWKKGIINSNEYDILKGYRISNKEKQKIENIFIEKDKKKFEDLRAEIDTLNKVYEIFSKGNEFLGKTKLTTEHYNHLKDVRKLSDEDIQRRGYFSFPTRHILKYFLKEVENAGIDLEELKNVPGFFYDKSKETYSFMSVKGGGIGIPLINEEGKIEAIQIRKDLVEVKNGKETAKYIFFSSSFTLNYDNLEGGVGSGTPIDIIYPKCMYDEHIKGIPSRAILLTEGIFKGEIASKTFNMITMSTQGVSSWKGTIKCLKNIKHKYRNQYIFDNVIIAYDADLGFNVGVLEQAIKSGLTYSGYTDEQVFKLTSLKKAKKENFLEEKEEPNTFFALWDVEDGKGIDDFILNGHQSKIRKVSLEKMYNMYLVYKEAIYNLVENGTYESLNVIPPELMKDFFEDIVLSKVLSI